MRVLFACGGTAGHINPALAVADTLRAQDPTVEILFVGNPNRMEATLVPQAGYDFTPLVVEGFHRSFRPKSLVHNFRSLWYLFRASRGVKEILRNFQPDLVMGTGGYVSGPVLRTAAKEGVPTLTHESNAYPGVTTKLLARYVNRILLAVEDAKNYLPEGKEYVITGNPVRPEMFQQDPEAARAALGIGDRMCVLSYGGSNGAAAINKAVAEVIATLQPMKKTHHIHATGRFGVESFPKTLENLGVDQTDPHLDIREYISNMAECIVAADLVICRAGAMTLSELQAIGRAAILVPSPNVAENHQYHNAMVLGRRNAAIVIEEKDLSGTRLTLLIQELLEDSQELVNIAQNAYNLGITDGAEKIAREIHRLYEETREETEIRS